LAGASSGGYGGSSVGAGETGGASDGIGGTTASAGGRQGSFGGTGGTGMGSGGSGPGGNSSPTNAEGDSNKGCSCTTAGGNRHPAGGLTSLIFAAIGAARRRKSQQARGR
jgi:MYXO-CTERM domain-containing protein